MNRFFHIISTVFSPLLVPTFAIILAMQLTVLAFLPSATRWSTVAILFIITAVLPALGIFMMHRLGLVSDASLSERAERTPPYVITAVCYLGAMFYLMKMHAPSWLWLFMAGAFVALAVDLLVTLRWKISAHMTAMGGLVALLFRLQVDGLGVHDLTLWICGAVILTGIVGTARIYRERHDLLQVLAGTACGFLSVFLITMIHI